MEILTFQFETYVWIQIPEELDQHAAEIIRKKCEIIFMDYRRRNIVFDFSRTVFMDSGGVGMIMGRYRQISSMGGKIYIFRPQKRVLRILEMSGLMRLVEICEDMKQMEAIMKKD